jgi:hypothetical protein
VKLHSVFLRNDCILPGHLNPSREAFGEHWMCVKVIPAAVFDTMIRQAGWHYIWLTGACTRAGLARTSEKAIERALDRAIKALSWQTIAADGDTVHPYCGAADSCMALATGSIRCMLAWLDGHSGASGATSV